MESNILLKKFRELDIDKSAIGLNWNGDDVVYFCTPVGAEIIAWEGVDGIHYCFIPYLDKNRVFVVSPMSCGKSHVEPIADNFTEFLSLILSCGDSSPLEQISRIGEADFSKLLESNGEFLIDDKVEVLNKIQITFGIEKLTDPYRYVKSIQEHFAYSSIPYSDEYYDITGLERS